MDAVEVLRKLADEIEKNPRAQIVAARSERAARNDHGRPIEDVRFAGAYIVVIVGNRE